MGTFKDLTGQKFGRLTVLHRAENHVPPSGRPQVRWHCRCDCGNEVDVLANGLRKGTTTSCGCYHKERVAAKGKLRVVDLTGQVFGRLTVLCRAEDYVEPSGHHSAKWHCRCDCGNEVDVISSNLRKGNTKSCGCLNEPRDLTGQQFGRLTVLYRAEDYVEPSGCHVIKWHCRCDCGNEVDVTGNSLKSGNSKSCGCYQKERAAEIGSAFLVDLTGQRFGRLSVLDRAAPIVSPSGHKRSMWHCRCDCGNEVVVSTSHLRNGHTKSCGCYRDELVKNPSNFIDLTGQRFGKLLVTGKGNARKFQSGQATVWHCRCDCGTEIDVQYANLKSGNTKSCGCEKSWMEGNVIAYLNSCGYFQDVDYEYQKRYDELTGIGGRKLSYDFLVYRDGHPYYLIECQGEQHTRPVDYFGGFEKFEIQQFHDELKREHAEQMGVPLLEIPHTATTYEKVAEILRQSGI